MRILYVTSESPIFPSGGIGTYLAYMAEAMADAGHEVFLYTWAAPEKRPSEPDTRPFRPENVVIDYFDTNEAWRSIPVQGGNLLITTFLRERILQLVHDLAIDVVETTDFMSPALAAYQDLQSSKRARDQLCVTYNHGFIEDFYEADQITQSRGAAYDHISERQQCRISDLVVAPSQAAAARLASYGLTERVAIEREPFRFSEPGTAFPGLRTEVQYLGRISISKGIDKLILFCNVVDPVMPIDEIRLIGRLVDTPFRVSPIKDYVTKRLRGGLADRVEFAGFHPRDEAIAMLDAGALCPNLGSAETFSYACVEAIDRGLMPIVRAGTPMAEFFPENRQDCILDERMASPRAIQTKVERIAADAEAIHTDIRAHCEETLAPTRVAERMTELYERAFAEKRGRNQRPSAARAGIDDVTVIMPVFKPDAEFCETIDSLMRQTTGQPRVLICDDGTPEDDAAWFEYPKACLDRCTIVRQPNMGLLGARNCLIENCETRLAVFLDADDLLEPRFMERMLEAYNESLVRPQAVLCQRQNFLESGEPILRNMMHDHMHLLANDFRMTALIETDVLRNIGFDATRRNGEGDDWVFWLDFTARGYRTAFVPEALFLYRFRTGSMSWPWSQGQYVGTFSMVRDVMQKYADDANPLVRDAVRALYAVNVVID